MQLPRLRSGVVLSLLRRNRDYRLVFLAQVVSFAGDWFATVALVGLVIDRTGSDLAATLVWVAASLPSFLVTGLAGPVADRFNRKTIMVTAGFLQAAFASLFLFGQNGWIGFGFVAQGTIAALGAFFGPASSAALPNLVAKEDLATATAISGAVWGAMLAVGSALGAVVAQTFGRRTAFVVDGISFIVSALLILAIRGSTRAPVDAGASAGANAKPTARMRPIADTKEAIRYARGNRFVSVFLLSKFGAGLGTGVVGLLPLLAKREFHAGDAGIGVLLTARGLGVLLGPFAVRKVDRSGLRALVTLSGFGVVLYGLSYLAVPFMPTIALAAVFVFIGHIGGGAQWTGSTLGLQRSADDSVRGRIMAADFALATLSMSLSFAVAGITSTAFGPKPTILGLAVVEMTWGTFYLWRTRALRGSALAAEADVTHHRPTDHVTSQTASFTSPTESPTEEQSHAL